MRRFDLDGDEKLTHEEYLKGIDPLEPYSKVLVKENIENKEVMAILLGGKISDTKSAKSTRTANSPNRGGSRNQKKEDPANPVLEKAFEKYVKSDEFVGCSPLKYRRPLPIIDLLP